MIPARPDKSQITASSLFLLANNSFARALTVSNFVKSTSTPSSFIRPSSSMLRVGASTLLAPFSTVCKYASSLLSVDSLFLTSRVEKRRCSFCDWGRVKRNSSIKRQHIAKPRPLYGSEISASFA